MGRLAPPVIPATGTQPVDQGWGNGQVGYGASLDLPWVKSPEASGNTGDYPTSETVKPIFGHRDQILVTMTIPIVIATNFWSRWQFQLSLWPNFCHDDKKLVTRQFQLSSWPNFCHDDKKLVTWQKIKKNRKKGPNFFFFACCLLSWPTHHNWSRNSWEGIMQLNPKQHITESSSQMRNVEPSPA